MRSNLNFKVKVERELYVEEFHPGSDRTSRSVAQNQVPIDTNRILSQRGSSVAFTNYLSPEAT
jgi:hypothetical protein